MVRNTIDMYHDKVGLCAQSTSTIIQTIVHKSGPKAHVIIQRERECSM